jgi:acetyl esterase/lipase
MSREQRAQIDAMLRRPGTAPATPPTVEESRAEFEALMARRIVPDGLRGTQTALDGRPALLVEPEHGARGGTILYFHGGVWVLGSPETALWLTGNLAVRTGFRVFSLDYRLAPEHPFPAAIDDCLGAYRALLDRGEDPAGIVFAGDSAGGGLAVTTSLAAREAGLPLPAAILGFSAMSDVTWASGSMRTKAGVDPIFTREILARTTDLYLAGADPHQPLLSPAVSADLAGLPPMLLQAGTDEVLLDDSARLASRASAAGVDVILDITAGVSHVFQGFAGVLDEADQALDRAAHFLLQQVRAAGSAPGLLDE